MLGLCDNIERQSEVDISKKNDTHAYGASVGFGWFSNGTTIVRVAEQASGQTRRSSTAHESAVNWRLCGRMIK